jgi:hypothetical protein
MISHPIKQFLINKLIYLVLDLLSIQMIYFDRNFIQVAEIRQKILAFLLLPSCMKAKMGYFPIH